MALAGRTFGILGVVLVIAALATGTYLRLSGKDDGGSGGSSVAAVPEGGASQVSSADNFSTDVPIPVEAARVRRDTLVVSVAAAAEAAAFRQTRLLSQVEGRVMRVRVRENASVAGGQVLVEIDTTEYALTAARARAQVDKAAATYRELTLFDDQIEDPEIRAGRAGVARAKSGLQDAEIALREAELRLSRTQIRVPFPGRVASLRVVESQTVRVGDEILTIVDLDPVKVEVQVLEGEVGLLAEGRRARVTFAAFPGEEFLGRVQTINPLVERQTRTARVTVMIPNPDGRILPGMYARVALEARKFPDRILVPRSAVLERDRRTMLFVFQGEGTVGLAKWRYVTIGMANDSVVEVVSNPDTEMVEPGEWVLTDGHFTLIHDARVRRVESVQAEGGRP
ncbi:MAG: efflux RND transporter periplasmic adaptor subunit [Gemmatimonadota bacterium]|nr:efflux RND transporter periplasmic adaptor subunit [Gemmatimonadota bacterium]MDH3368741.1 efflux RND transporter periplasmic adaptor subunit [Gemmatimonadota bacterium]MDH3478186.1 efflux RND transporter periplasmic adaptor subunit [Gemmatimonadota bacterium]MDH5550315.1 efflux RND transporter periplasmic adaptor subunit [Gemmatimonadota bacterium]